MLRFITIAIASALLFPAGVGFAQENDAIIKKLKEQVERQQKEIILLEKTIAEREALIVELEADMKVVRVQAANFEGLARARQTQNEILLQLVRELTRKVALLESGGKPKAVGKPNELNPPAVNVNGKIEKVDDKDPTLVQISLGTDHGINKNHTLQV